MNNKLFLILLVFLAFLKGAWAQDAYTYIDCSWDAENKTVVQTLRAIPLNVTTVNSSMGAFVGWNVVRGNVTINGNVRCRGHVKLILCDNAHLTITGGLTVQREPSTIDSLTIYCQSYGSSMGKLTVTCNTNRYAGIGGGMLTSASVTNGPITIHGGDITTTGGPNGVGLGSRVEYYYGVPSPITIYGGRVEAHGGEKAGSSGEEFGCAGIGLIVRSGSMLNVYGGNVYAYGADDAAGIGGCSGYPISHFGGGDGGTVHIYGGRVEAHGGKYGAGIGGGQNGNGSIVTVHGGSVYAYGGTDAAGIGSGEEKEDAKNGGSLTVTGGTVEAHGGKYGAGIGGGQDASGANVTISGGIVNAYGGTDAAGVGSGEEVSAGEGAIKSRNGSISYANGQWRGNFNFDIRQMYKIEVSADCEITLTGVPVNPSEYEITISHGINWIGFLPNESMSVNEAFSGLNPVTGDVVKSKNGSVTYNGTVWRGTLTLEPRNGYIYQSEAAGDKTFTFPTSTR